MFGLLHPVGPEGERTYWIRRAVVLAVAIVLVAAVVMALVRLTAGAADGDPHADPAPAAKTPAAEDPAPEDAPQPSAAPEATPQDQQEDANPDAQQPSETAPEGDRRSAEDQAVEEQPTPEGDAEGTPEAAPEPPAAPQPTTQPQRLEAPLCTPENVAVTVDGPQDVAADAGAQAFGVVATNTGQENCTLPLSAENLKMSIFNGTEQVWTTEDCPAAIPARTVVLAPGTWLSSDIAWGLSRSAPGCGTGEGALPTGSYRVVAEVTDVAPAQHELELR